MHDIDHMSKDERARRIANLLAKAVTLRVEADRAAIPSTGRPVTLPRQDYIDDWISRGIIDYVKRVRWAKPIDMIRYLNIRRTTCFRRLKLLRQKGLIASCGHGKGVQYRLTQ